MHTEMRLESFIGGAIYRAKIVPLDILDEIERTEAEIEELKRLRTTGGKQWEVSCEKWAVSSKPEKIYSQWKDHLQPVKIKSS